MAASKGRDFKLKIGNGSSPATFTAIGGLRTKSFTVNNEEVDITDDDNAPWKQLLSGAGLKSVAISGNGIFKDDTAIQALQALAFNTTSNQQEFQLVDSTTGDIFQGVFHVASYEEAGEYNGAKTFSLSLSSASIITLIRA